METVYIADLEADGLLHDATRVWCAVFKNYTTHEITKFGPDEIPEMLEFMDTVDVLIMHNGIGYDWPLLKKLYGYEYRGRKVDTLLISRLQNPNRRSPPLCPNKTAPHSVEAWGYRVGRGKPQHDDWTQFSKEMLHRCSEDVEIQHLLCKALLKEGKGKKWEKAHLLTNKLFTHLQRQEEYGWLVDKDHMARCLAMLDHWIERIDRSVTPLLPLRVVVKETKKDGDYGYVKKPFKRDGNLTVVSNRFIDSCGICDGMGVLSGPYSRVGFRRTDLDSNKEVKEFLLAEGWIPDEWNTKDGKRTSPKLSKDSKFEGVQGSLGRLVSKRVQCRSRRSILTGWCGLIRPDGAIASVVGGIAATGRAKHKGIVNVPGGKSFFGKWMRQIFISREDMVLVGTDSDACQIRMLAARMGDDGYTKSVLMGRRETHTDVHSINQRAAGLASRDDAKTFFYGIIFGAGDAKTGRIIGGNAGDGAALKAKFFAGLPALGNLVDRLTREWRSRAKKRLGKWGRMEWYDGWVEGLDGRPIYIPSEHMILVYMLQSDEAIMMSAAYCMFHKWMEEEGYVWGEDYGTVCWYHDEWTVECKRHIAERVGVLSTRAITWAGKYYSISCPHEGNFKIGETWWDIH